MKIDYGFGDAQTPMIHETPWSIAPCNVSVGAHTCPPDEILFIQPNVIEFDQRIDIQPVSMPNSSA